MDKNKFLIAIIVFIVVFGGIFAIKAFSPKDTLTVIEPGQILPETVDPSTEETDTTPMAPDVAKHPLLGTEWSWVKTTYLTGADTIPPAEKFVINFGDDKMLNSTTDCNSLFSKFILDGEILSIGPIGATKMACQGQTLEAKYTQELSRATSHVIKGDELRINLYKDTGTMIFSRR